MASNAVNWMTAGGAGAYDHLFGGDSGAPYDAAMEQYKKYGQQAQETQQPYLDAGKGAIPDYQNWLKTQQDPSGFINHLMTQYQQSPYSQYLQQQSMLAGQNAGSASGMTGSTPLMLQMQQNAGNISSQDMQKWLAEVLGINTNYGQGQQNLMQAGQNSANSLTNMYGDMGNKMGEQSYNKSTAGQNDWWNKASNAATIASMFL